METIEKIDVVVPWVDDQDPQWQQARDLYAAAFSDKKQTIHKFYRDWNTLLYVFRGIERFMPWVNKVHLLTHGHVPDWLNTRCNKLNVVAHKDFFLNPSHLPTFNSQAIEMNFLGIRGLADKFIYFNDDTLVLKKAPVSRFYRNGLPLDFLIQDIPRQGFLYRRLISNDSYVDTMANNLRLINREFSKKALCRKNPKLFCSPEYSLKSRLNNWFFNLGPRYYWFSNYHFQQPYLKSDIERTYSLFKEEMDLTSSSRFRNRHDVNQYLYRYVRLADGRFVPYEPKDTYCLVLKSYEHFAKNKDKIRHARFFCPNDSPYISEEDYLRTKEELTALLNHILPEKSIFEK